MQYPLFLMPNYGKPYYYSQMPIFKLTLAIRSWKVRSNEGGEERGEHTIIDTAVTILGTMSRKFPPPFRSREERKKKAIEAWGEEEE